MKEFQLAAEAVDEANDAADWYESRRTGLGSAFLAELDRCLDLLAEHPQAFPRLADTDPRLGIRRALLNRFPYAVVFIELPDRLHVLAVAHTSRRPGYWLNRIVNT
jgi:plasmid stabilization system protein ParE